MDHVINLYMYRSAAENKLSWERVTEELKATMEWSEEAILVIGHIWKEEGSSIIDVQQRMLNIGQVCCVTILNNIGTAVHNLQK